MASPPPSPKPQDPSPPSSASAASAAADPREDPATGDASVEIEVSTNEEGGGEDEVGECGFCAWMKGGGCKDAFTAWEDCVRDSEESGEDVADKCFEATSLLKKCMEAHRDYYDPILQAEKAMAEEVQSEQEAESNKAAAAAEESSAEPKWASPPVLVSETSDLQPKSESHGGWENLQRIAGFITVTIYGKK